MINAILTYLLVSMSLATSIALGVVSELLSYTIALK